MNKYIKRFKLAGNGIKYNLWLYMQQASYQARAVVAWKILLTDLDQPPEGILRKNREEEPVQSHYTSASLSSLKPDDPVLQKSNT